MAETVKTTTARAAPRRARKDPNEAPVFLQKTYQMIDTAPVGVAGWSEEGDTFVVKDLEEFANLLPRFFKHRNFRSFVRQLNFYGFRKMRTDGALISNRPAHWWEFRHEKFLKGKPELLTHIKRANHYEAGPGEEGDGPTVVVTPDNSTEVAGLKGKVAELTNTIEHLTSLVDKMLAERRTGQIDASIPEGAMSTAEVLAALNSKKRKLNGIPPMSGSSVQPALTTAPSSSPLRNGRTDSMNMIRPFGDEPDEATLFSQLSLDSKSLDVGPTRQESLDSIGTIDFDADALQDVPPLAPYLATAALGAFFTQIAESAASTDGGFNDAFALSHPYISEGKPLSRTSSVEGVYVHA